MKSDGTEEFILLDKIIVSEEFLNTTPSVDKIQKVINYVKRTGVLDEPITINRNTMILTDGYTRYISALKLGIDLVPIVYENELLHNK
ncbi:hypothetical protein J7I93_09320 [Bacillus sp. ISL-47]|uniref:hypothetical protein n=1 Tax=Bacillus sp. ISL-47 TaxID=2819130 RepID=UPI001BE7C603|nr:hypothetical protein [Bacillus sp. ISL-47]MBT2688381.1 hypothetical protein [Bacillus sp. ISL-47]MBT2710508.1 hypothetical protein [Pseudomonas sp. ISL-84]